MKKNESFNTAAARYNEVRPAYEPVVIDWIVRQTGITRDDQLLEIGPGTGQATIPFAEKGFHIHCVEFGDKLAAILRHNCERSPNVTIDVSPFETWESAQFNTFALIYSASAFHWIEETVKYKKCAQLLTDNGHLALLWHEYPDTETAIINQAFELLTSYTSIKETDQKKITRKERMQARIDEINTSGYFQFLETYEYPWSIDQSPERFLKGFMTQSSFLSLEEPARTELSVQLSRLFSGHGKSIPTEFISTVYLAGKYSKH
jgi:trans-aconitate methyltransferase